jgi:hypothetical protein
MNLRLLALFVLFAASADAGQLYLHMVSAHVPRYEHVDETNWGLAYRFDAGPRIGAYQNSYGFTSAYAAWVFRPEGHVHPWVGAVTGYSLHGEHLDPDATGVGGDRNGVIPLVALEIDATKWLRARHWWPKKVPDLGLILLPWVVNLEVQF